MSGASLSRRAWEVLRALGLGIKIRELEDGWQAVGPWQEPSSSGVETICMGELLQAGFVTRETLGIGCYATMTEAGEKALSEKSDWELREAVEWLRSGASGLKT